MPGHTEQSLDQLQGCLAHRAFVPENLWHRRDTEDEDWAYRSINPFTLDVCKLLGSKALARLNDKTQVFLARTNPHLRTRMRHTLDVVETALKIASVAGLNASLTEAIALGHDIGHLPFGHHGERAATEIAGYEVSHNEFGVFVAQRVERKGRGLNLTHETLGGILAHSRGRQGRLSEASLVPTENLPLEAGVVMYADKISYTFADLNDAVRIYGAEDPRVAELRPQADWFGNNQRQRELTCIRALLGESAEKGTVSFDESEVAIRFRELREQMYHEIYEKFARQRLIDGLMRAFDLIQNTPLFRGHNPLVLLCLLTDRNASELIEISDDHDAIPERFVETSGMGEIYPFVQEGVFNPDDLGLDWG